MEPGSRPDATGEADETMTMLRILFLAINMVALVVVIVLYLRLRKTERKRRVEAPNSRYRSRYVEDVEAKERWERLNLDRMHEINREEVERILSKLRATSVRALTEAERAFLDRMVEAEQRAAGSRRAPAAGSA